MKLFLFNALFLTTLAIAIPLLQHDIGPDISSAAASLDPRKGFTTDGAVSTFTKPTDFGGEVSYADWTAKDGVLDGADKDKILYIKSFINMIISRVPKAKRNILFWSAASSKEDTENMKEFISVNLKGNGVRYYDIFTEADMKQMGLKSAIGMDLFYRFANRNSKALAAAATNGKAYIYILPDNGRTIFSPPSQEPMAKDPKHGGVATIGEIWHHMELPRLMRNRNIDQIIAVHKDPKTKKLVTEVAWDVTRDKAKPRTFLPDWKVDVAPLVFPKESGRDPVKRGENF